MLATAALERLLQFAKERGLLPAEDVRHARNALLFALGIDSPEGPPLPDDSALPPTATPMLERLADIAVSKNQIQGGQDDRDQFGAHLMNLLTPPPSQIQKAFKALWEDRGIRAATDWFYSLCRANDYIRVDQVAKNAAFEAHSPYGDLEITINLSKPEKDPRDIAAQRNAKQTGYPSCMLCVENEGYAGRLGYPSHETLRMVPLKVGGEPWWLQYSPYVYYDEHCIALNERHIPMSIQKRAFALLLDLVEQIPHYFFGSNADLPIVGGSILTHDHFQGGQHVFPMDKAPAYAAYAHLEYPAVAVEAVRWPMTCVRLASRERDSLVSLADRLLTVWRAYDDASQDVLHETDGTPHNTITPIARKSEDGTYQLQLVLRNNRTTDEHPWGIFHPHEELHHIKRENIGLIEVMGLFILPGRLQNELAELEGVLTGDISLTEPDAQSPLAKHYPWMLELAKEHGNSLPQSAAQKVLRDALGMKCARVLEDAGVFKATEAGNLALNRFLAAAGLEKR